MGMGGGLMAKEYKRPFIGRVLVPEKGTPEGLIIMGKPFSLSSGLNPGGRGFVGHYREDKPRNSQHAYVWRKDGALWYAINHTDEYNPHYHPVKHFFWDVCK